MPPPPSIRSAGDALREGRALAAQGRFAESAKLVDAALKRSPGDADLHHLRAAVAERLREWPSMLGHAERVEAIDPARPPLDAMIGIALLRLGRFEEAWPRLERDVLTRPQSWNAWTSVGSARLGRGDLDGALDAQRRAVRLAPDESGPSTALARLLLEMGLPDEATQVLEAFLQRRPDAAEPMRLIAYCALFQPSRTPIALDGVHRRAGAALALASAPGGDKVAGSVPLERARPAGTRQLRVGFVSPDFRDHSVASFALPLIEALAAGSAAGSAGLSPILFHTAPLCDSITARFRRAAPLRVVADLGGAALVAAIRRERLDIAIDLAGLSFGHRIAEFAARLAPLQATWLGYPATTGVRAIDVRLVDGITDPLATATAGAERLVRLEGCFVCWRSRVDAPPPARAPLGPARRAPTFGCFNDLAKLSAPTLQAWGAILARIPDSRLLVKAYGLRHGTAQRLLRERLAAVGIAAERVELRGYSPDQQAHLAMYGEVDVALDTFPYNGTTTTMESLWMGSPVVAVAGATHHARVGASLLHAAGLPELVADDVAGYIDRAVELGLDHRRLESLHASLRSRLSASPLLDAPGFARRFEAALRSIG